METNKPNWVAGYKEVKNFMHNELGITKEMMDDIITKIVKEEVATVVGRNGEFIRHAIREVIRDEIISAITKEIYPRGYSNIWNYTSEAEQPFNKFMSDVAKEEIIKMLREEFTIGIDIKQSLRKGE